MRLDWETRAADLPRLGIMAPRFGARRATHFVLGDRVVVLVPMIRTIAFLICSNY